MARKRKSRKTPASSKPKPKTSAKQVNPPSRGDPPPKLEHVLSADELQIHRQKEKSDGATDGGACLCMHSGPPTEYKEHTCSYRWQCHKKAKTRDRSIFNDRSDALIGFGKVETDATKNKDTGKIHPLKYFTKINAPSVSGDWWLTGPKRADYVQHHRFRIPEGENFTDWRWPYWHNAHHMIPKSLFWGMISGSTLAFKTMRTALLEAEYNIHHGINMIFSPMDEEVAAALNLPRHLTAIAMKNHQKYNARVSERLKGIIDEYKRICDDEIKNNHPDPDPQLNKTQLEDLSTDCRTEILRLGRRTPGAPLDKAGPITAG